MNSPNPTNSTGPAACIQNPGSPSARLSTFPLKLLEEILSGSPDPEKEREFLQRFKEFKSKKIEPTHLELVQKKLGLFLEQDLSKQENALNAFMLIEILNEREFALPFEFHSPKLILGLLEHKFQDKAISLLNIFFETIRKLDLEQAELIVKTAYIQKMDLFINKWISLNYLLQFSEKQSHFHLSSIYDLINVVNELLDSRLKNQVGEKDIKGKTPLHYLCEYGHVDIVKRLCFLARPSFTSSIDDEDQDGKTALHLVNGKNGVEIAGEIGLMEDVNLFAKNDSKKIPIPFHYACQNGDRAVAIELYGLTKALNELEMQTIHLFVLLKSYVKGGIWILQKIFMALCSLKENKVTI